MKRLLRYLRSRRFQRDLHAETQAHLEEKIDQLIAAGYSPEEAEAQAQRQFGNRTSVAESCREQWAYAPLDELSQDLRFAARVLRKSPVFAAVAVLSLALGIGANTVIFSAVNHVLLRSLPYRDASRLFAVWSRSAAHGVEPMHVSPADFYDWRAQSRTLESLSAYSSWPMNLTNVDEPRRLETQLVSANLFSTLGISPAIGRAFLPDEDQEQSPFVVVLSHRLWRALGQSPQIIGQQLTLNGSPATVIGVMPANFAFPAPEIEAWVPLSLSAKNRFSREGRWLSVIARLAPQARREDAAVEMDVISRRLQAAYPATNKGWSVALVPLHDQFVGKSRPILMTLQVGALLLLLIACANLANLLLARGASRTREIALRIALGARRARVLRQLFVESSLLALLGGSLGLVLAAQGITLVRAFGEGLIPRAGEIHLSGPVIIFAIAATLVTALIFGLAPALYISRADLGPQIGAAARSTPRHTERQRGVLVTIEIALASVLLVISALLGQSLLRLLSTPPGMQTDHLLTLRLTLSRSQYPTNLAQITFFDQVLARVRNLSGILAAGEISDTPLKGNNPSLEFVVEGLVRRPSDAPIQAGLRAISTGYLRAAGIPILKGRDFDIHDRTGALPVAILNETMARRYWPGINPVGRRLHSNDDSQWITVAGVVPDIKHMGLQADEGPVVYIPYAQKTQDWLAWTTLVVRTAGEPMDFVPSVRAAIRQLDKNQPVAEIGTLDQVLSLATAIPRFTTTVIGVLSGFALLIAVIGIYGLLAYTVARRTPELGIRLTLGASPRRLSWLLLRQAMVRLFAGIALGLLLAWSLARSLQSLLFAVSPRDPTIFAAVAALLFLTSLAAVLIPARRAMRIDPAASLRADAG